MTGIEPAFSAWEADVLPLNYTRDAVDDSRLPVDEALWVVGGPQGHGRRKKDVVQRSCGGLNPTASIRSQPSSRAIPGR